MDGPGKREPAKKHISHIKRIEAEDLPSSCDGRFNVEAAASSIVRVSIEAAKRLAQELRTFPQAPTINAKEQQNESIILFRLHKHLRKNESILMVATCDPRL